MWFVVSTGKGKENAAKSFLLAKVKGAKEVYITPYRKIRHINEKGQTVETVAPLLMNFVFVNIKVVRRISSKFLGLRTNVGEKTMVFRQLSKCVGNGGYFKYHVRQYDPETGKNVMSSKNSHYHLLCSNPSDTPIEKIMEQSWVPDSAMNAFMVYNSQVFSSADQLRVEPVSYKELIKENDTVRVLHGQFAGQEGVVKRSHQGKKSDRRFYIEFSNNLCLSISGIHQNDVAIVHEATEGGNSKKVSLWRDIDTVIGAIQFDGHPDDAPKVLRHLLKSYGQKLLDILPNLTDADKIKAEKDAERITTSHKREVLSHVSPQVRNVFKVIADFFETVASTDKKILREYIPNFPIRPFLTPTAGTELGSKDFTTLQHEGFVEYVVKTDLSEFFNIDTFDKQKFSPVFDEDYQYYAHVAIVDDNGTRKAVAPWGGFYDHFAQLSIPQRKELAQTLLKRKYTKAFQLLGMEQYIDKEQNNTPITGNEQAGNAETSCVFEEVNGIGGFTMTVREGSDYPTVQELITTVAPVAVEIWQGTRLQEWRNYLQRYVLLHKVPIIDQPTVIAEDDKLGELFNTKDADGNPDLKTISIGINEYAKSVLDAFNVNDLYKAVSIFLKIAKYSSSAFVDNEMYNYLGEKGYEPDTVCTQLYNETISTVHDRQLKKYLHRGYAELSGTDAWKYFHLPSFLKKALHSNNN